MLPSWIRTGRFCSAPERGASSQVWIVVAATATATVTEALAHYRWLKPIHWRMREPSGVDLSACRLPYCCCCC